MFALRSFVEFNAAYEKCKGQFDVIINCVSARINFSGVLGMLAPDGVAVQVRASVLDLQSKSTLCRMRQFTRGEVLTITMCAMQHTKSMRVQCVATLLWTEVEHSFVVSCISSPLCWRSWQ